MNASEQRPSMTEARARCWLYAKATLQTVTTTPQATIHRMRRVGPGRVSSNLVNCFSSGSQGAKRNQSTQSEPYSGRESRFTPDELEVPTPTPTASPAHARSDAATSSKPVRTPEARAENYSDRNCMKTTLVRCACYYEKWAGEIGRERLFLQ